MSIIYIEPTSDEIRLYKTLIKKQGDGVCRGNIDIETISHSLDIFNFGFLAISRKAQIGKRRLSGEDEYLLRGFVLCYFDPFKLDVNVELVCAAAHTRLGRPLMKEVEEKAIELGAKTISLECIDTDGLQYESLGFKFSRTKYIRNMIPKVHLMVKYL